MSPLEQALQALEPFAAALENGDEASADNDDLWESSIAMSLCYGDIRRAAQALADLSSVRLEEGDVEKAIRIMKSARVSHLAPACVEHNAAIERILSALGHGGEGL